MNRSELWKLLKSIVDKPDIFWHNSTSIKIQAEIDSILKERKRIDDIAKQVESDKVFNECKKTDDLIKKKKLERLANIKRLDKRSTCSICLDLIDTAYTLSCGHIFHSHCIRGLVYLYLDSKCPLCRVENVYNFILSKKQKRKLNRDMTTYHTNVYGRISVSDFIKLYQFITQSCIYMPNWIKKIHSPLSMCIKDHKNIYNIGWIDILTMDKGYINIYLTSHSFDNEYLMSLARQDV